MHMTAGTGYRDPDIVPGNLVNDAVDCSVGPEPAILVRVLSCREASARGDPVTERSRRKDTGIGQGFQCDQSGLGSDSSLFQ
jgi:hypothetical protein